MSWTDDEVAKAEETYGNAMPAHNKATLRSMLEREEKWWATEEGRILKDNNRYHDDY